jgi:hypothetical protein
VILARWLVGGSPSGPWGTFACPGVEVAGAVLDAGCCGADGVGVSVASAAAVDVDFYGVDHCVSL